MFSISAHEFGHAYVAFKMGDDTAARHGHLSLNPLVQMGTTSMLMLCLIGVAWGQVPVQEQNVKKAWQRAAVSLSGPATNFCLCAFFALGWALTGRASSAVADFFGIAAMGNGVLFVLNLLPVPMLDGWGILSSFLAPLRRLSASQRQTFTWIFLMLIFLTELGAFIWQGGQLLAETWHLAWQSLFALFV